MALLWAEFVKLSGGQELLGEKEILERKKSLTIILGLTENLVYMGSWLLGGKEIIPIVIALKAQPSLKEWSENKMLGRTQFNVWLVGNLLNVAFSVLAIEILKSFIQ